MNGTINDATDYTIEIAFVIGKVLRTLPKRTILSSWVFDNFILADELFAKALWSLKTCLSVSNNLCRKLVSFVESQTSKIQSSFLLLILFSWVVN